MARRPESQGAGCVYRGLGARVRCGRCVPYMRALVEDAKASRPPASAQLDDAADSAR